MSDNIAVKRRTISIVLSAAFMSVKYDIYWVWD